MAKLPPRYDVNAQFYVSFVDNAHPEKGVMPRDGFSFLKCKCGGTKWICVVDLPFVAMQEHTPHGGQVPLSTLLCWDCLNVIADFRKVSK